MKDKLISMIGIIGGIVSLVFSATVFTLDTGSYVSNNSYGGDAYTGIQNAGAAAARNIMYLSKIVQTGLGALLAVIGIHMICIYTLKLMNNSQVKAVVNNTPPAVPVDKEFEEVNKF